MAVVDGAGEGGRALEADAARHRRPGRRWPGRDGPLAGPRSARPRRGAVRGGLDLPCHLHAEHVLRLHGLVPPERRRRVHGRRRVRATGDPGRHDEPDARGVPDAGLRHPRPRGRLRAAERADAPPVGLDGPARGAVAALAAGGGDPGPRPRPGAGDAEGRPQPPDPGRPGRVDHRPPLLDLDDRDTRPHPSRVHLVGQWAAPARLDRSAPAGRPGLRGRGRPGGTRRSAAARPAGPHGRSRQTGSSRTDTSPGTNPGMGSPDRRRRPADDRSGRRHREPAGCCHPLRGAGGRDAVRANHCRPYAGGRLRPRGPAARPLPGRCRDRPGRIEPPHAAAGRAGRSDGVLPADRRHRPRDLRHGGGDDRRIRHGPTAAAAGHDHRHRGRPDDVPGPHGAAAPGGRAGRQLQRSRRLLPAGVRRCPRCGGGAGPARRGVKVAPSAA